MIENELQRRTSQAQLERLQAALTQSRAQLPSNDTILYQAMLAGIESQIDDLRSELAEYDTNAEAPAVLEVESLADIPSALIKARAALGLTLDELSQRIRISPAELEAYEASGYRTARFEDIVRIARSLRVEIAVRPASN